MSGKHRFALPAHHPTYDAPTGGFSMLSQMNGGAIDLNNINAQLIPKLFTHYLDGSLKASVPINVNPALNNKMRITQNGFTLYKNLKMSEASGKPLEVKHLINCIVQYMQNQGGI